MAVTPLRDGMNLVAKEYVAARVDDGGALLLSEFTGAAAELHEAYLVNPHDVDGLKDTLVRALEADAGREPGPDARDAAARAHPRRPGLGPVLPAGAGTTGAAISALIMKLAS